MDATARFCSGCGAEVSLVVLQPLHAAAPPSPWPAADAVHDRGSGPPWWTGGMVAALLIALLVWRGVSGNRVDEQTAGADAAPSTLPASESVTTGTASTERRGESTAISTTIPRQPPPDHVELPTGMEGRLYAVSDDLLFNIDLRSGAVTAFPLQQHEWFREIVALNGAIIGLSDIEGVVRIAPDGSQQRQLLGEYDGRSHYAEVLGHDSHRLLIRYFGEASPDELVEVRADGTVVRHQPQSAQTVLSGTGPMVFSDGKLVRQLGQGIALVDFDTGQARFVMEGALIAANEHVVVRHLCQPDATCHYRTTKYDGTDLWSMPAPSLRSERTGAGTVSSDGRTLAQHVFPFAGPNGLRITDLSTGTSHVLGVVDQNRSEDSGPLLTGGRAHRVSVIAEQITLAPLDGGGAVTLELNRPIQAVTATGP
ncbi:MAG: hypothetical protein ACKV2O_22275 [Acidimicrobiales bacterium]